VLPLKDDNPTRRFPILTVLLIALNIGIFGFQSTRSDAQKFSTRAELAASQSGIICEFGVVPDRVLDGRAPTDDPCLDLNRRQARATGLITHQFVHASWLHVLGNMLFLWVFGNNIEDRLGRIRFLPFYLLCGIIAALGQALTDPSSSAPLIGASGAISGVLGAYFVLFPRVKVLSLVTIFPLRLPAWLVLGVYIALQFLYVGGQAQKGQGGVAFWAHIIGFAAGMLLILPFLAGRRMPVERTA
jgi:membrane associated rhomboid family serine protease